MFGDYLDEFILNLESVQLIQDSSKGNLAKKIKKELEKYQEAILAKLYFEQLLEEKVDKKLEEKVLKIIEINKVDYENKAILYSFKKIENKLNKYKNPKEVYKVILKSFGTIEMMYNTALISIIIVFEKFITELFKNILEAYPNAYLNDKKIEYESIIKYEKIDELKNKIIQQEVDEIMRESIFSWIKKLNDKHKLNINLNNEYIKIFVEAYLRRNIIIHNDSKINLDYIKGMKNIGEIINEKEIGKKLLCNSKYILLAIDASIYVAIYFLYSMLVVFPDEREDLTNKIMDLGFEKIENKEYKLAREIFRLMKNDKDLNSQMHIYAAINYWQTYKWEGNYSEIEAEVNNFDFSACEKIIKLAIYALKNEYGNIEEILNAEFSNENENSDLAWQLEEFPVFQRLRKQKFYIDMKEKYKKIFNKYYSKIEEIEDSITEKVVKKDKGSFSISIDIS